MKEKVQDVLEVKHNKLQKRTALDWITFVVFIRINVYLICVVKTEMFYFYISLFDFLNATVK